MVSIQHDSQVNDMAIFQARPEQKRRRRKGKTTEPVLQSVSQSKENDQDQHDDGDYSILSGSLFDRVTGSIAIHHHRQPSRESMINHWGMLERWIHKGRRMTTMMIENMAPDFDYYSKQIIIKLILREKEPGKVTGEQGLRPRQGLWRKQVLLSGLSDWSIERTSDLWELPPYAYE